LRSVEVIAPEHVPDARVNMAEKNDDKPRSDRQVLMTLENLRECVNVRLTSKMLPCNLNFANASPHQISHTR